MIGCLILYHPSILSLTKCRMLRSMFYKYDIEIHVLEQSTVLIFIWNIELEEIWQATMIIENENIAVGYGFNNHKLKAAEKAKRRLNKRLNKPLYKSL